MPTDAKSSSVSLSASGEAPGPQETGLGLTFRSLRHRNYRLYFFGQLVSLLGSWMQTTALLWLAYDLTGKSTWPALITAAQIVPTFLLGAWSGALADRWPKRVLILGTQSAFLLEALVLAGLVLAGDVSPWQLLVLTLFQGVVQAIDLPARLAFVMDLVGRDDLMNAVGLNSVLFNVARTLGPALAGWVLIASGPGLCFLINAVSYLAVLIALLYMQEADFAHRSAGGPTSRWAGFRYLADHPPLAWLVLLAGVLSLVGWPFLTLLPAFAEKVLHQRASGYSAMLSGTGAGALVAAWTIARFGSLAYRRTFLRLGVCLLSVALLGLSLAEQRPLAVAACALAGFGLILYFATAQAVVQLSVADHHRGRVMGTWAMVLSGAVPLGNLLNGRAADLWGEPLVLRLQALVCFAAALALLIGRFRLADRLSSAFDTPDP